MVISNEADDFCVGANLLLVLMGAKTGQWDMIEQSVKAVPGFFSGDQIFQKASRGCALWSNFGWWL